MGVFVCHIWNIFIFHYLRTNLKIRKKCGKVISLLSFLECSVARVSFCQFCLSLYPEKSSQNGLKTQFKTQLFIIDHTTLSILDPLQYLSLYSTHDFEMRAHFLLIAAFHVVE